VCNQCKGHRTVSHEEHLDAKHPGALERLRSLLSQCAGAFTELGVASAQRRENEMADVVLVHGLHRRVRANLAVARADSHDSDLLDERHPTLRVQRPAAECSQCLLSLRRVTHDKIAPAVIGECAALEHERQSQLSGCRTDRLWGRLYGNVVRDGYAMCAEVLLLHELVLDDPDCARRRVHLHRTGQSNLLEYARVNVLDLDREHVDARRELADLDRVRERAVDVSGRRRARRNNLFGRTTIATVEDDDGNVEQSRLGREHAPELAAA
jgi:hypothetical protein